MMLFLMQKSACNAHYSTIHMIQCQVLGIIIDPMQPTCQSINTSLHASMIIFAMDSKMGIII